MSLELRATAQCDRCGGVQDMENVDDEIEARGRLIEAGWCESEDGDDMCPECWAKWDESNPEAGPCESVGDAPLKDQK